MDEDNDKRKERKAKQLQKISLRENQRAKIRQIKKILKKSHNDYTEEERKVLEESTSLVHLAEVRKQKKLLLDERLKEVEEPLHILEEKCLKLAEAIKKSKSIIVYTGAGISTAAQIPDYRGPNGVWTQLNKSGIFNKQCDLTLAEPTYTHMAIAELCNKGIIKHVVSQNCDGLHIRSGIRQENLSEIHGNMYIEVCNNCKTQYLREFDVTEKTSLHRHKTGRKCHCCDNENNYLIDTIVHFGEKGKLSWPLNWTSAAKAVVSADMILCLGSSLKILRRYSCLWPKKHPKPELYIVNLQWTPKDSQANLKIHAKCDFVMKEVMKHLSIDVKPYQKNSDPIYYFSTPLKPEEQDTCHRIKLFDIKEGDEEKIQSSISYFPSWFGKGLRKKK